jgi:HTH-type transcriptional regulator / antitoxin HipB
MTPTQHAKQIRARRTALGLSHTELASKAGISRRQLIRMEQGESVRVCTLDRVARAIGFQVCLQPRGRTAA